MAGVSDKTFLLLLGGGYLLELLNFQMYFKNVNNADIAGCFRFSVSYYFGIELAFSIRVLANRCLDDGI